MNIKILLTKILFISILGALLIVPSLREVFANWSIWEPASVYYDFEGPAGSAYVKDRRGSNDLTLTAVSGNSAYIEAGTLTGNVAFFPRGVEYGVADDSAEFSQTSSFSIEAWVKFNNISSANNRIQTILAKWDETSDDRSYRLIVQTDSTGRVFPKFQISTDGTSGNIKTVTGKTQILAKQWYLFQGYYDATVGSGTIYIYINGVREGSTASVGASITDEPSNFYLATTKTGSSTYANFLQGSIDEIRLLSGTRGEGSLAYSMKRGKPVAKIRFNDGSGIQAMDSSSFDNRGALINFPTDNSQWVQGISNYALEFGGTDDYVDLGSKNSLQLGKAITISTWINISSSGSYTIVSQPHTNGYTFSLTSGGEMTFGALGGTTVTSSGAAVGTAEWTHVAVAYDGSTVYFYKNGRVISSSALSLWSVTDGAVFIGKAGSTPNYFSGKMDGLLIYPYNRTLFEIFLDVNGGNIKLSKLKSLEPANEEMACPEGYIWVPGDPLFETSDFCVMKYEAKCDVDGDGIGETATGDHAACITSTSYDTWGNILSGCKCETDKGGNIVSSAAGYALARIAQDDGTVDDAKSYCESVGSHLITNDEWMTIARNVERSGNDWCDLDGDNCGFSPGQSSKYLVAGHNDNSPSEALQASTDDTEACYGTVTTDVNTACGSAGTQRRTHTLSNGQIIWDLAGNVWEWTNDTVQRKDQPDSETSGTPDVGFGWTDFASGSLTRILVNNGQGSSMGYDVFRPSDSSWNANQRVGRIYTYSDVDDTSTTVYAFRRGAGWDDAAICWRLHTASELYTWQHWGLQDRVPLCGRPLRNLSYVS